MKNTNVNFHDTFAANLLVFSNMSLKMLHPTSGRRNFNILSEKPKVSSTQEQSSATTKQEHTIETPENKFQIDARTKDAISKVTLCQSQSTSSDPKPMN